MKKRTWENFRPMLGASKAPDLDKLIYPLIASPKIDGIRVLHHPTRGIVTRSLKPVRNDYIRAVLEKYLPIGFDGEVCVGDPCDPNVFNNTTGPVRRKTGTPNFVYLAFDHFGAGYNTKNGIRDWPYKKRVEYLKLHENLNSRIQILTTDPISNPAEAIAIFRKHIQLGYEGTILRCPNAPYKFGRSTLKQQGLLKLKNRGDTNAVIIGFEPLMENHNIPTKDIMGLQERSGHKNNKVAIDMLGKLNVIGIQEPFIGVRFNVGSGFDHTLRTKIWHNKEKYIGLEINVTHHVTGAQDKPREPIFKGFIND